MKVKEWMNEHNNVVSQMHNSENINDLMMLRATIIPTVNNMIVNNTLRERITKWLDTRAKELLEKEI